MQKLINGEFESCNKADLNDGDVYRLPVGRDGWRQLVYEITPKADTERQWRDSELLRTDIWPDDRPPGGQAISSYRVELRDYPAQPDFPNGTRPEIEE